MGKGSGGTSTTVSQSAPPADVTAQYDKLIAAANNAAGQPLQQYQGNTVAPTTAQQQSGYNTINGLQGIAQPYINSAQQMVQNSTQPIWSGVQQFSPSAVQQYMSPYTSNVLNTTMAAENNQDAQQQQGLVGNAISSGAWGGDRSAVAQGILGGQQAIANNATNAGIVNQGYTQGLSEFNTQQQNQLGANEATAYLGAQGANLEGQLGGEALNTGITGANANIAAGQLQQTQNQAELNVPYEQFLQQQAYPMQDLSWLSNISEGIGSSSGGTSSTTTPAPSTAQQLGGLGIAGLGLYEGAQQARGGRVHRAMGGIIPHLASGGTGGIVSNGNGSFSYPFQSSIGSSSASSMAETSPGVFHYPFQDIIASGASAANPTASLAATNGSSTAISNPQGILGNGQSSSSDKMAAIKQLADPKTGLIDPKYLSLKRGGIVGYDNGGSIMPPDLSVSYFPSPSSNGSGKIGGGPPAAPKGINSSTSGGIGGNSIASDAARGKMLYNAGMGADSLFNNIFPSAGTDVGVGANTFAALGPEGAIGAEAGDAAAGSDIAAGADTFAAADSASWLSTVGDAISAFFLAQGGAVPARARGGIVGYDGGGGVTPFDTSTNPMANNRTSQYAGMDVQSLRQLATRLPAGSPQAQIVQQVLQKKQMMPNASAQQSATAQPTMARGGIVGHFDTGGNADNNDTPDAEANARDALNMGSADGKLANYGTMPAPPAPLPSSSDSAVSDLKAIASPSGVAPATAPSGGIVSDYKQTAPVNKPNPWLSLAAAGFGMAASNSPHALQAAGEGGIEGLKNYQEQQKEAGEQSYQQGTISENAQKLAQEAGQHKDQMELENKGLQQKQQIIDQGKYTFSPMGDVLNTKTGDIKPGPMASSSAPTVDASGTPLTGDAYLSSLPPRRASIAKAIAMGDMPWPTGFALKNPIMAQGMQDALTYDPQANANRMPAVRAFNTGPLGNQVRSFSVGISHLNTLNTLADALDNGDTRLLNTAANAWKNQTGLPAPTDFNTAKQIVGDEIVKAIVGAGGGVGDRDKAQQVISAAGSPAELKGAINTYKSLMRGQLGGLQQQYENSTGRKDFLTKLTPEARTEISGATTQGAAPDMVRVTDANGRTGSIPRANLTGALKAGYQQVQ